jgi:hypothetical protein
MNYEKLYVNLLLKHGTEVKPINGYFERHHIIPKALGGDDSSDNLVYLSGRAHFIAHWILYKIHQCNKTARAFFGMCDMQNREDRYKPTSRIYEIAKSTFAKHNHMKEDNHRVRSANNALEQWKNPEARDKLVKGLMPMFENKEHPMYMKGKVGDAHPRSRKVSTPFGIFGSVREAGKTIGVVHNQISRRCKSDSLKYSEYFYID